MLNTLRFGIEIETVGLGREGLANAIQSVVGGTKTADYRSWKIVDAKGRSWRVVPDGSLSGGEQSGEIVSPVLGYDDIDELQQVVRAVRNSGGRSDQSCGIHVHIDGSRFDARGVTNLVKMVHKQERLIEQALGISETRLQRYCRPVDAEFIRRLESRRPRTMQEVSDAWYGRRNANPDRYDSSRYHGLNLNSLFFRGTIELRFFNGTTHAGEIKSYIQFALALAAKALGSKAASSRRREYNAATSKYDMRVWLLGLGMIGDEFKTARLHLLKKLGGSAAWKGERRDRAQGDQPAAQEERAA
jgi:hypothetical protein